MGSHSIIAPSSAHIWGPDDGCTGYVEMVQQFPEPEETVEAAEGTATHEIGSRLIMNQSTGNIANKASDFVGKTASNGVIFTDEMYESARVYSDDVGDIMRSAAVFGGPCFGNEHHVKAPKIHELSHGTIDQFIFDRGKGHLYLWDLKHGHGIVEAFENWQLINYTAGIVDQFEINGLDDQHITVHMRIVQPRAFHRDGEIREWVINLSDLRAYFNTLSTNAGIALSDNAVCRSGSHCKHCNARHGCEAALRAGMSLYEVSTDPTPITLSGAALGLQLQIIKRAKKQLEYLESGFDEQVKNLIRSGVDVPGWMVENGYGREKWAKPVDEVIAFGDMMGQNLRKPDDAITPVQARKLGIDDAVIKAYSITPSTGLKIVPDNGNKARLIFGEKTS